MTYREYWLKANGFKASDSPTLSAIAKKTKYTKSTLQKIIDRGVAAYHNNYSSVREKGTYKKGTNAPPSKKLSPSQWGWARMYAWLAKQQKGVKVNHDRDLLK